jgi:hypothetical protein
MLLSSTLGAKFVCIGLLRHEKFFVSSFEDNNLKNRQNESIKITEDKAWGTMSRGLHLFLYKSPDPGLESLHLAGQLSQLEFQLCLLQLDRLRHLHTVHFTAWIA